MHIKDFFNNSGPVMSLEVFPPKANSPLDSIISTVEATQDLDVSFISVTYGAGGSSRTHTAEIADLIKNKYQVEALAHLTCVGSGRDDIDEILEDFQSKNIKNVLALRGDPPQDGQTVSSQFSYAQDLIEHIRRRGDFCLSAACYPEGHIDSRDLDADIHYLRQKVQAGADYLITQMFFDNDLFYRFRDKLKGAGVDCPVLAGIMPVLNLRQIERIRKLGGISIPEPLLALAERYGNDKAAFQAAGIDYAAAQIRHLLASGADGVHLYAMNRPEVAASILAAVN